MRVSGASFVVAITSATLAAALATALTLAPLACSSSSTSAAADAGATEAAASSEADASDEAGLAPDVTLVAAIDLPREIATQGLSSTAFDGATRTLYAIQDTRPSIVPLVVSEDLRAITVGTPITLTGRPTPAWDGEGLARTSAGSFIAVTDETVPIVERFDGSGAFTGAVTIPAQYANQALGNKGLESLTLSPSGRYLFTVNEAALMTDGTVSTKSRGTTVRILRRDLTSTTDTQFAYRTEPLGAGSGAGDMGVSEMAAIDDDHVLVMERGFQDGYGNTVRIFRVDLSTGTPIDQAAALMDTSPVIAKSLLIDLSTLPPAGITHPGVEPNPILDNYEALAIGPALAGGRRVLFVTSDDNASATQVARVLVLSVRGL